MEMILIAFSVNLFERLGESPPNLVQGLRLHPGHLAGRLLPVGFPTTRLVNAALPMPRIPRSHELNELITDLVGVAEIFDLGADQGRDVGAGGDGSRELLPPTTVGPADRPQEGDHDHDPQGPPARASTLARLKMERDILKKAAVYLGTEST